MKTFYHGWFIGTNLIGWSTSDTKATRSKTNVSTSLEISSKLQNISTTEAYLEACRTYTMERFCDSQKRSIVDVWLGFKHTSVSDMLHKPIKINCCIRLCRTQSLIFFFLKVIWKSFSHQNHLRSTISNIL